MNKIMNKLLLVLFLFFVVNLTYSQCYELIWSDEFDYTGYPDPEYWTPETGGGGFGNNELQYYTANDPDNASVDTGYLTITAIEESFGGRNYTSARLITRGKYNFMYGKIEARIRLPYGQGIWPAFWMMGENISEVGWPACGEIDILEMIGGPDGDKEVHGTVHWDNNGDHASYGGSYTLDSGKFADDFHLFSVEWSPASIRWYIDGIQYHVISITSDEQSEFHQDFFILLNMAVGGNWPGSPDGTTVFPQHMNVDYVRVYKGAGDIDVLEIEGDDEIPVKAENKSYALPFSPEWTYNWSVPEDAEITDGQGTETISVNWGCGPDTIHCEITGICDTYHLDKKISIRDTIYGPKFISEDESGVMFTVPPMTETQYSWGVPGDATIVSGVDNDTLIVDWGSVFEAVMVEIDNICGTRTLQSYPVKFGQYPYPDISAPWGIPGTIRSVDFDYGGEGNAYHDVSSGNEGDGPRQDTGVDTEYNDNDKPNVGWIQNGEWLEYTVDVDSSRWYDLSLRVATDNTSGGPFSILFNNRVVADGIVVSNTGGWDQFTTMKVGTFYLEETDSVMKFMFNTGGFNLGNIIFTSGKKPAGVFSPASGQIILYPVPANGHVNIQGIREPSQVSVYDLNGRNIMNNSTGTGTHQLNTGGLEKGVYLVRIAGASGKIYIRKLVKNN